MVLIVNGVRLKMTGYRVIVEDRNFAMSMDRKDAIIKYLMDEGFIQKGKARYYTMSRI
jgi:hypothetical protein